MWQKPCLESQQHTQPAAHPASSQQPASSSQQPAAAAADTKNSPETDIFHFVLAADNAPDRTHRRSNHIEDGGSKITGHIEDPKVDPQQGPPSGLQNPFRPWFWFYFDIVSSMRFFPKRLSENQTHRRWGTKMVAEYLLFSRYVI